MEDFIDKAHFQGDYAETWHVTEADADRVLWHHSHTELPFKLSDADVSQDWERLKKKEVDLDLHGLFLSDYYRSKRIPRGFRIRNVPPIGRSNPEFCKKWIGVLNRCSLDLMVLAIEEVAGELTRTRKSLVAFETQHGLADQALETRDPFVRAKAQVDKYKQELLRFKREKLRRVNEDYTSFRVYRWLTGEKDGAFGTQRPRWRKRVKLTHPLHSVDISSGDSEPDDATSGNVPSQTITHDISDAQDERPFLENTLPDSGRPPIGRGNTRSAVRGEGKRGRGRRI
ncbi:hypothetical protein XELAEV_18014337mg [Xenopus laevis]|uniref:Uncharacterized protein n=1 Tax=Xenopus laevis TaxID=8355 RepID=A0A974DHW2_XENLA|nr:hypothetical protein XELAEV_18014337mg [Xenopus laevis]